MTEQRSPHLLRLCGREHGVECSDQLLCAHSSFGRQRPSRPLLAISNEASNAQARELLTDVARGWHAQHLEQRLHVCGSEPPVTGPSAGELPKYENTRASGLKPLYGEAEGGRYDVTDADVIVRISSAVSSR